MGRGRCLFCCLSLANSKVSSVDNKDHGVEINAPFIHLMSTHRRPKTRVYGRFVDPLKISPLKPS